MTPEIPDQVAAILASKRQTNRPHPDEPGKRIIGFIVDENDIGLSTGLLALERIQKAAQANNR